MCEKEISQRDFARPGLHPPLAWQLLTKHWVQWKMDANCQTQAIFPCSETRSHSLIDQRCGREARRSAYHRLAAVDRHPILVQHVAWDGDGGQVQALRGELRDQGPPVRHRRLRHDGERGVDLRQAQARLRLRWRRDGRNLKLLVSQAGCVKSLPKTRRWKKKKKSWDEINKQINTSRKKNK